MINSDNLEFQIIDFALRSDNEEIRTIMEEILSKYSYQTENLIKDTAKYLTETTKYFWEEVIKENKYEETFKTYNAPVVNTGDGDTYTYQIYKGSKKSITLRCANTDTYYKIAEKKQNYIPKNVKVYNEEYYDTIPYNDLLNITIYSNNNFQKNIDFVKNALIHTYKEKLSDVSKTIIKEFYERIMALQPIYQNRLKEIEQKLLENQNESKRIRYNSQSIEQSLKIQCDNTNFSKENYYQAFRNIETSRKYKDHICLTSRKDVKEKIESLKKYIKKLIQEKQIDESIFQFDINKDEKKGWNWEIRNYVTNDILSAIGTITTFEEVPENLMKLINAIKKYILQLSIKYDHNPNYNEEYHSYRFKYHSEDTERSISIKSFESGILNIRINNNKISVSDLLKILNSIKELAKKVLKENVIVNVYKPELMDEMKESLREDIGLGDKGLDCIEDWEMEPYNWKLTSNYNEKTIDEYVKIIIEIINDIEEIIKYASENEKKASFFKRYTEYYKKLCDSNQKYDNSTKQIETNNSRIDEINKENDDLREEYIRISKILEEITNYQNIMETTKVLQKKEV